MNQHIIIIGAGLSGLATAYRLNRLRSDLEITLIEKNPRVGGNIATEVRDGFRFELGPNGFLDSKPSTIQLCRDLGLQDRLIAASESSRKNRYLFLKGQLRKLPGSLWSFLTSDLLNWRGKWMLATEKYRRSTPPDGDESIRDFVIRRAGRQAADIFADALVTGIQGGDPALLSVRACFPRLAQFEREFGSVMRGFSHARKQRRAEARARGEEPQPPRMWSFREGLGVLIDALAEQTNATKVMDVAVQRIERTDDGWIVHREGDDHWQADAVVLTSPAYEQARMLAEVDGELAEEIRAIEYNRIAVVVLGFRQADVPDAPDGFGYIAPQRTLRDVLGVQWCSAIFPERAPEGMVLWRALCGGWHRAEMVDWDDERLTRAVVDELKLAMGVQGEPVFHHIVRWHRAIPQYWVGHLDRVARIESLAARHRGLYLGGNAYHGIAMNDCTEQAELLAQRIVADFAPES